MDIKELLVRAEKDRAIRAALLMLKDIVHMASVLGGICHISADYFAKKYNYNPRTFFRHKRCLVKHGYIREKSRWQVEVVDPIEVKHCDTNVAKCDSNVGLNNSKNCDKNVKNRDTFVQKSDTNVIQKQINKKTKDNRERQNASSSFVALPQSLNPFGNLKLTQSQLEALTAKHSETVLQHELPRVSAWLANQEPNKWRNHFAGLTNWLSNEFGKKAKANFNPYATSAGNW
ncbi:hypothetical protein [Entomospira culicis]|uniref:Uncharacterized protein n=1 Tax=Entomospira culicis TaxID=2719989 RepID=A0A968KU99_9SPIO|nr:hypothetical protein [Entomospira culicis]NIZ19105.1 hypothetical protein [Entomospira culicis]NIZ69319.1 hypothetical protein [Entomospira culicis]WDI37905.1 hypothetical protein PVA46_03710 [Entomospira culicis]WDI39532.1 hypothetical protein PVA47_03710 [Entomospira culicis]